MLRQLNPSATLLEATHCDVELSAIINTGRFDLDKVCDLKYMSVCVCLMCTFSVRMPCVGSGQPARPCNLSAEQS